MSDIFTLLIGESRKKLRTSLNLQRDKKLCRKLLHQALRHRLDNCKAPEKNYITKHASTSLERDIILSRSEIWLMSIIRIHFHTLHSSTYKNHVLYRNIKSVLRDSPSGDHFVSSRGGSSDTV